MQMDGKKEAYREPHTEILETDDGAMLVIEMPGVPQDQIKMEVSKDLVTVEGKGSRAHFKTIQVMPFDPDPERVAVTYSQGVLEVMLHESRTESKPDIMGEECSKGGQVETKEKTPEIPLEDVETELSQMRERLLKVSEEKNSLEERVNLLQRDFQNLKRRHETEKERIADSKIEKLALGLVEVLDNFERARDSVLGSGCPKRNIDNILQGLSLVENHVFTLFRNMGIHEVESLGGTFDPEFHEAVGQVNDPKKEDQVVVEERVKGYVYKGRALRPAQVVVNRVPESTSSEKGRGSRSKKTK